MAVAVSPAATPSSNPTSIVDAERGAETTSGVYDGSPAVKALIHWVGVALAVLHEAGSLTIAGDPVVIAGLERAYGDVTQNHNVAISPRHSDS